MTDPSPFKLALDEIKSLKSLIDSGRATEFERLKMDKMVKDMTEHVTISLHQLFTDLEKV